MSGHVKGLEAAATALDTGPFERGTWTVDEVARVAVDAYMRASNPVGQADTIYDDFYRLRAVSRVVLESWDSGSGTVQADAMEALRAALIASGDTPSRGRSDD